MSKSLGNFYTMKDLLDKGYTGREIRYELIGTHYRQPLNFTFASLDANRSALKRLDEFYFNLKDQNTDGTIDELPSWASTARDHFIREMDDDMNISGALSALFELVHKGNIQFKENKIKSGQAAAILSLWDDFDLVLGLLKPDLEEIPRNIIEIANLRKSARNEKRWDESDRLRDEIESLGWTIKDSADGYKIRKLQ